MAGVFPFHPECVIDLCRMRTTTLMILWLVLFCPGCGYISEIIVKLPPSVRMQRELAALERELDAYKVALAARKEIDQESFREFIEPKQNTAEENIAAAWRDLSERPVCVRCFEEHFRKASDAVAVLKHEVQIN